MFVNNNGSKVEELFPAPNDTISDLAWNPVRLDCLLSTAWNKQVALWDINTKKLLVDIYVDEPPLTACWHEEGNSAFVACCDGKAFGLDFQTNTQTIVGQHTRGISFIKWDIVNHLLITGGWDNVVSFWDCRQLKPGFQISLPNRLYCADIKRDAFIIGTAERHICIYNLANLSQPFRHFLSPLKYQSRCISLFPDTKGFAVGSIEGRVAIQDILDSNNSNNYAFKCHRQKNLFFPVNDISFHPDGYFSTCGSDGFVLWWDKDKKIKIKDFEQGNAPVTCCTFNSNGTLFAYSVGYDWTKGTQFALDNLTLMSPHIYIFRNY